jgi:hypothetical protein
VGGKGGDRKKGEEMTQTSYVHMNKRKKKEMCLMLPYSVDFEPDTKMTCLSNLHTTQKSKMSLGFNGSHL